MAELRDRAGLAAGLESAGIAWRELDDPERITYAIDGVMPSAICWPATYAEAAAALLVADRLELKVAPRGAGTKVGIGMPPIGCDLIISTERLNQIVEYATANLTVTAQAGLSLAALQATLADGHQYLPLDPPHADRATLGGIAAANASGPRRLGYGSARDLVIGTQAATTTGKVVRAGGRVVKNVAGYDLSKLYIGSLGTLVLLVELGFKVAPRPEAQTTVVGRFASLDQVQAAVGRVVRSPLLPSALDLLNAPAAARLSGADRPDARHGYLLAGLGEAPGGALRRQRDDLVKMFREAGADEAAAVDDSDRFWSRLIETVGPSGSSGAIRAKISVPIGAVATATGRAEAAFGALGERPCIVGRAGTGVLTVEWPPVELAAGKQADTVAAALQTLRGQIRELGGSLVIEDCPLALKSQLDIWGEIGPALGMMQRLKKALDPKATMNPGRFVGGI